jgi:glycosyltransferase involved in cell wall biosynthesis
MRVLSVAYPFAPVGRDAAGGAEQVLTLIDEAIVEAGHDSLVLAAAESSCRGRLLAVPPCARTVDAETRRQVHTWMRRSLEHTLDRFEVDVVHMHGVDFAEYLPPAGPAMVATLHLPPSFYPPSAFAIPRARSTIAFVSESQRRNAPPVASAEVVQNGIDVGAFSPTNTGKERFVAVLGRICPEKGYHLAIDAAKRAGVDLVIAGRVFPYEEHVRYFDEAIAPRLDAHCRFVGPVGQDAKRKLLAQARCLVVPSVVAETSSLVAMEALACGTPVVAAPVGELPRIIDHGETGFLASGVEATADAIDRTPTIDGRWCRRVAEERFCARTMARRYLALYDRVSGGTS